jgi:hypothetical protein
LNELSAKQFNIGPVDVERQCGVMKDGVACARSLTCKSHSMGAKRAVAGRSLPYDMLLAAYQKKNQAKQQSKHLTFLLLIQTHNHLRSSNRCQRSTRRRGCRSRSCRLRRRADPCNGRSLKLESSTRRPPAGPRTN